MADRDDAEALKAILDRGYAETGAYDAQFLFLYTDLRSFGYAASAFADRAAFFRAFVDPLVERGCTIVTPTFSYTTEGTFDTASTPTRLGAINKWFIGNPDALRSEHPLFSVAALGPGAEIARGVGKSAFGADSIFDRLIGKNACYLHVGRPVAVGNTGVHYAEQACGATYRYNKAFPTKVHRAGEYVGTDYSAFVRRRDVEGHDFDFVFPVGVTALRDEVGIRQVGSDADYTSIACYPYDAAMDCFMRLFYRRPSAFIAHEFIGYD